MDVTLAVNLLTMLVIAMFAVIAVRRVLKARAQPQVVTRAADGSVVIPVRQNLWQGGTLLGAMTRNSLSPTLAIAPDGLHFKVLRETVWPFATISRIDVGKTLFGYELRFAGEGELRSSVANAEVARAALAALPPNAPLTNAARALRGG